MADKDEKLYTDSHVKTYNKMANMELMPVEKHIEMNELYHSAKIEGLNALKNKRAKDYEHGVNLLTDALIKFRKASKHPHASEDADHKHLYAREVREFLDQYARSNKMDAEGVEKLFKKGEIGTVAEALMGSEKESMLESKIDYEFRNVLKRDNKNVKGVAEYMLEQNPHIKKSLSAAKISRLKNDYETLLNAIKQQYMQTYENKLNDFNVPEKKEDDKKKK